MLHLIKKLFTTLFIFLCVSAAAKDVLVNPYTINLNLPRVLPGDRVLFEPGEYRTSLFLPANKSWLTATPTTFKAISPGQVVVKGSDIVQGWVPVDGARYVTDWTSEPAQVFIDGIALIQLAGSIFGGYPDLPIDAYKGMHKESGGIWPGRVPYTLGSPMPMNSFFYDKTNRKLFINVQNNPNQKRVEVSVRGRLFYAERVNGITLDGLIFEHSNTSMSGRGAAVTIIGDGNTINGVTVRQVDLVGIQMVGDRNQLLNSIVRHSGQLGVAMRGAYNLVSNVDASYNNTRGFNKWWEAGGFKFVGKGGLQASEVVGSTAIGNTGDGIWFDWNNKNNILRNNISAYNSGFGIHYEASQSGAIQDNFVFGNGLHGIYLSDTSNSWVTHNVVVGNGLNGITVVFSGRKDENGTEFGAEGNKVYANIIGWNKGLSLIMPKVASGAGESDGNVYLTNPKLMQFSLGFPSMTSPAVRSLSDWTNQSGFDKRSVLDPMQIPPEIASALSKKITHLDWSVVRSAAIDLRNKSGFHLYGLVLPAGQEDIIGPRK